MSKHKNGTKAAFIDKNAQNAMKIADETTAISVFDAKNVKNDEKSQNATKPADEVTEEKFSDEKDVKIDENGQNPTCSCGGIEAENLALRAEIAGLRGELDALLEAARESPDGRDDYIWAVLTGEPVLDPAERLRAVYPQLLHVEYAHTGQADTVTAAAARLEEQTDEQLFAAFFEKMNGQPMTEREYARLRAALQKEETV